MISTKRRATPKGPSSPVPPAKKPRIYKPCYPFETVTGNSITQGKYVLDWLVHPLKTKKFFSTIFQKQPQLNHNRPTKFETLISLAEIRSWLSAGKLRYGVDLDVTRYNITDGRKSLNGPHGIVAGMEAWDHWESGASLRLLRPQVLSDSLYHLLAHLEGVVECVVGANVYLTPAGCQGFAPHFDDIDAFVCQVAGRKRWKVYGPRSDGLDLLPRRSSIDLQREDVDDTKVAMDVVLKPGDMLYMPRGTIHEAVTVGTSKDKKVPAASQKRRTEKDYSLHVTVSMFQKWTWADFLAESVSQAIKSAAVEDVALRRTLPVRFGRVAGFGAQGVNDDLKSWFHQKVRKMVKRVGKEYPTDAAADMLASRFMRERLPPVWVRSNKGDGEEGVVDDGDSMEVTRNCWVRAVCDGVARVVVQQDGHLSGIPLMLSCVRNRRDREPPTDGDDEDNQSSVTCLPDEAEAINSILDMYPQAVQVKKVKFGKNMAERLELVQGLIDMGILCIINAPVAVDSAVTGRREISSRRLRLTMQYVAAIDQGTTSTRVIIFDSEANPVCTSQLEHATYRPHPGWEEHDPLEILLNVKLCINQCVTIATVEHSITPQQIKAIGITNQRETTVIWNKHTGKPLHNAIVWQDLRTQSTCDALRASHDSEHVRRTTGLPISTYFSGVKLRWLIDNVSAVRAAIDDGSALFGTIDTWLLWNLTEQKSHLTDVTNAGRTMLMNLNTLQWDDEMLGMIGVSLDILPEIRPCRDEFGTLKDTLLEGVTVRGVIGDQQAALVGQSCFNFGEAKSTYGTGCFLIINTGTKPKLSNKGLLTTPAYKLGRDEECVYSLEGSVAVAGSAVTWMRDAMGIIESASDSEVVAESVADTGGVYVVPAFTGLYAPWWREDARGAILGITQYTTRAHIVRATLESMAFTVNDVLRAATEDMGGNAIAEVRVDGGVSHNNLVMQMQADVTASSVVRPEVTETTAMGAAFVAGTGIGAFDSMDKFRQAWRLDRRFEPQIEEHAREQKLRKWNMAVQRSLGWE